MPGCHAQNNGSDIARILGQMLVLHNELQFFSKTVSEMKFASIVILMLHQY